MSSPNVEKILHDADSLTEVERLELLRLLEQHCDSASAETAKDQLSRRLLADGLVSHLPPGKKDLDRYRSWHPVAIKGKPLSQTIVEERR
jgi:hypothetical protein